jgi:hypothetical protein
MEPLLNDWEGDFESSSITGTNPSRILNSASCCLSANTKRSLLGSSSQDAPLGQMTRAEGERSIGGSNDSDCSSSNETQQLIRRSTARRAHL